jgi:radical S-adenosyl methionine domain-containing protein 2
MQYLRIRGQNWGARNLEINREIFARFLSRHEGVSGLVAETSDDMLGSYIMVDPTGRPYGNVGNRVRYGNPILQAGLLGQLDALGYNSNSTEARGGFTYF